MEEQIDTGTARQMREEQEQRANENELCIVCGLGDDSIESFLLCDGGQVGGEWHTGLHQPLRCGWHYSCIPDTALGAPKDEVFSSGEDQPWCCVPCAQELGNNGTWIGWKISEQKRISNRLHYMVHWLGCDEPSWQPYTDVSGTSMLRVWRSRD